MRSTIRPMIGAIFLLAVLPSLTRMAAQSPPPAIKTLYNFTGQAVTTPYSNLVLSGGGVLYGTALSGFGAVFALTPPGPSGGAWTESMLYEFQGRGKADGSSPQAGVVIGKGGVLYGTTAYGGGSTGRGTVFALAPPSSSGGAWTETVLHEFTGQGGDGSEPFGGLVIGASGELYGTTSYGGTFGYGTVFELAPPTAPGGTWTATILYSFAGAPNDGRQPSAALVIGSGRALYGTTLLGGASNFGTVFELSPPATQGGAWTNTVLHSFAGLNIDGVAPFGGVVFGANGALYGTTLKGGSSNLGTVFELAPVSGGGWTETVLYNFTGLNGDGIQPYAGISVGTGGVLYGTTYGGGSAAVGTAFQLTPPVAGGAWIETVLHSFTGLNGDGKQPRGGLVMGYRGVLYGSTVSGGTANLGTIFQLIP